MIKASARFGSDADLRRGVEHGLDCGLRSRPCAFLRPLRGVPCHEILQVRAQR